jgi:hypothetical protein
VDQRKRAALLAALAAAVSVLASSAHGVALDWASLGAGSAAGLAYLASTVSKKISRVYAQSGPYRIVADSVDGCLPIMGGLGRSCLYRCPARCGGTGRQAARPARARPGAGGALPACSRPV